VALWHCGVVALWRCGAMALWRCGTVALQRHLREGVLLDSVTGSLCDV